MDFEGWERATWRILENRSPDEADRNYTHAEVRTVIDAALEALVAELISGGNLSLSEFGRLEVRTRRAREVFSHLNGEQRVYAIAVRKVLQFRPSRVLIERINGKGRS